MSKPNINPEIQGAGRMRLPDLQILPTAAKQINLWMGRGAGWPWNTSERITRSDLRL